MKKSTWRKQHKWLGIIVSIIMMMFCVSGILLNHRTLIKDMNVSRAYLPSRYEYHDWNGGLLRGTLACGDTVLLYGSGGIWQTTVSATTFSDYNQGLPQGADYRQIRNVVRTRQGDLIAVAPFGLYRRDRHGAWRAMDVAPGGDDRWTDVAVCGDTLVALSRSAAYVSLTPYTSFRRIKLQAPAAHDARPTAFRTVWLLHSGQLFGTPGRLVADAVAAVLALLCVSGLVFWLRPKHKALLQTTLRLHDALGRRTIVLTLLIALTGWCLRPPVMIALVNGRLPVLPGTTLDSDNPWNDKLRALRHDDTAADWLLSTSDGFFSLDLSRGTTKAIAATPPVSVMGLNVLQKNSEGQWLCGSFSGLYVWDRQHGTATDYFTGEPAPAKVGAPFGRKAVSGMSQDFATPVVAEYGTGTPFAPQPSFMNRLPMSLWNVALEVHSGRMFIGDAATYVFVFVTGLLALWCLWSGYIIRLRKRQAKRH